MSVDVYAYMFTKKLKFHHCSCEMLLLTSIVNVFVYLFLFECLSEVSLFVVWSQNICTYVLNRQFNMKSNLTTTHLQYYQQQKKILLCNNECTIRFFFHSVCWTFKRKFSHFFVVSATDFPLMILSLKKNVICNWIKGSCNFRKWLNIFACGFAIKKLFTLLTCERVTKCT